MLKLPKTQYASYFRLGAGLVIIALLTALSGLWHFQSETSASVTNKPNLALVGHKKSSGSAANSLAPAADTGQSAASALQQPSSSKISQVAGDTTAKTYSNSTAPASVSGSNASTPQTNQIYAGLTVDGTYKGRVQLSTGSTQCDLLTQALAQSIISSLDMRYSSQYGTEAVYVIDDIGDPGSVWWTYKVNGTAPPYGCQYVTVHNNDSVSWQYVKN